MNEDGGVIHSLKTWPVYFQQIADGQKTFEIRKNDRNFQTGDYLRLFEYDPAIKTYTGRWKIFQIGFILQGEFGLPADVCLLSLKPPTEPIEAYGGQCHRHRTIFIPSSQFDNKCPACYWELQHGNLRAAAQQ